MPNKQTLIHGQLSLSQHNRYTVLQQEKDNCQLLVKTQAIFDRSSRCKDSAALRLASLADGLALSWLHRVLVNMVSILIRLVGAAFEDRLDFDEQAELED